LYNNSIQIFFNETFMNETISAFGGDNSSWNETYLTNKYALWINDSGDAFYVGNVSVSGDILPNATLSHDLGSGARRWAWLYVQNISAEFINVLNDLDVTGTIFATTLNVTNTYFKDVWSITTVVYGNETIQGNLSVEDRLYLNGTFIDDWKDINGADGNYSKTTDGRFVYNNSIQIFFNETFMNETISVLATGGNSSWNESYANTKYLTTYNATYDATTKEWDGNKSALIGTINNASYLPDGNCSFGPDNQIPFTNAGGDDFDYSSNFNFDGTGTLNLGDEDTDEGYITLYGEGAGDDQGGRIDFHTSADNDGTNQYYVAEAYGDEFRIRAPSHTDFQLHPAGQLSFPLQTSISLRSNSDQTISTATWTKVTLANEQWDKAGEAANSMVTVTEAGTYLIVGVTRWKDQIAANKNIYTAIYVDQSLQTPLTLIKSGATFGAAATQNVVMLANLNAGQDIELYVQQGSGGNIDLQAYGCFLQVIKVA